MRKMKKLAALCLAMLMAFSLMAVTASAYDAAGHEHDETCAEAMVQPRRPAVMCYSCGQEMVVANSWDAGIKGIAFIFECKTSGCSNKGGTVGPVYWKP